MKESKYEPGDKVGYKNQLWIVVSTIGCMVTIRLPNGEKANVNEKKVKRPEDF